MAKGDKNNVVLNLEITADSAQLETLLKRVSDKLSTALSNSLSSAVKGFGTELGKNIQVAFDGTVLGKLNKPITIKLDVDDAKAKVDSLVKPLRQVITQLDKATEATGGKNSKTKTSDLTLRQQQVKRTEVNKEVNQAS